MVPVKTARMTFEGYFFNKETLKMVSVKRKKLKEIKPLEDRIKPTWRLFQNGRYYIVTLAEIWEFTLGLKNNSAFRAH